MRLFSPHLAVLGFAFASLVACSAGDEREATTDSASTRAAHFDDSAPDRIRVKMPGYSVDLAKSNGAILAVVDRATGQSVTRGSRNGCLWGTVYDGSPSYYGGCLYDAAGANRFSYAWDSRHTTLRLAYRWAPSAARGVDADVTIAFDDAHAFSVTLAVSNHSGSLLREALVPSDLSFDDSAVRSAFVPFLLPGTRLNPGFFTSNRTWTPSYPSDGAFADFLALELGSGRFAVYTAEQPDRIQPAALGFTDDEAANPHSFFLTHALHTWVPDGASWTSPRVRVRVGEPANASAIAYREDNGIAGYPSVSAKLGARMDQTASSLFMKAAWRPFRDLSTALDGLPTGLLLHPVAFQAGGHDVNYPNFLPPDPRMGTVADFRDFVLKAQGRGDLVMPYINPTWWDPSSPTARGLPAPLTIRDIAVRDANGSPVYETYGPHTGFIVSHHVQFVQEELGRLLTQWKAEVPVDFVFEDQIGARAWRLDFNPAAPSPIAYSDGWLAHTATYADRGLMTEMGWDRLARTELGFMGSTLAWQIGWGYADNAWGAGNWAPYPVAPLMFHDKVLMYQHDLAPETLTTDKRTLQWNMASGTMLGYLWDWAEDPKNAAWLELLLELQQKVCARFAGRAMLDYADLAFNVSQSRFDGISVVTNWYPGTTADVDDSRLAPQGFLARSDDSAVVAGIFSGRFRGVDLTPGDHYLIVEVTGGTTTIHQPIGGATDVAVDVPSAWAAGMPLVLEALDPSGMVLRTSAPAAVQSRVARFTYDMINGAMPAAYRLRVQ